MSASHASQIRLDQAGSDKKLSQSSITLISAKVFPRFQNSRPRQSGLCTESQHDFPWVLELPILAKSALDSVSARFPLVSRTPDLAKVGSRFSLATIFFSFTNFRSRQSRLSLKPRHDFSRTSTIQWRRNASTFR